MRDSDHAKIIDLAQTENHIPGQIDPGGIKYTAAMIGVAADPGRYSGVVLTATWASPAEIQSCSPGGSSPRRSLFSFHPLPLSGLLQYRGRPGRNRRGSVCGRMSPSSVGGDHSSRLGQRLERVDARQCSQIGIKTAGSFAHRSPRPEHKEKKHGLPLPVHASACSIEGRRPWP